MNIPPAAQNLCLRSVLPDVFGGCAPEELVEGGGEIGWGCEAYHISYLSYGMLFLQEQASSFVEPDCFDEFVRRYAKQSL